MTKKCALIFSVAAVALTLARTAPAQAPLKDPQVRLVAAMKHAAELNSLGFTESFKSGTTANGSASEAALKGEFVLRGKEDLSALFNMQQQQIRVASDGTTHSLYIIGDKTYQQTDQAIPRPQLMAVVTRGGLNAAANWVAGFLHNQPELLDSAEKVESKGAQNIDGADCDGYVLAYAKYDVTAWLTQGDPPALRRAELDLTKSGGSASANVQVDITDWKPGVETKDNQFVFTPPDGVVVAKPGTDALEGKAAPDFEVPLLDGGSVKLSALKGQVVVLDIWATWCGPCRRAMPIVDKVTGEFTDKGVVLYAVNQGEEPEAVKKFLAATKLNPRVALDTEGRVSRAYEASSIPRIILIDKGGVVRKVFRGLSPDFENELRSELAALVKDAASAK